MWHAVFHEKFEPIREHLEKTKAKIVSVSVEDPVATKLFLGFGYAFEPAEPPFEVSVEGAQEYFDQTEYYWGAHAKRYLMVGSLNVTKTIGWEDAFQLIENGEDEELFCLVGYNDGGILSISKRQLAFQKEADPAVHWHNGVF